MLAPGAILLGNPGTCFECGHEHGVGDRCLSFHYTPAIHGERAGRRARRQAARLRGPHLPPSLRLAPLVAGAEAARDGGDAAEFEEIALGLAGAAADGAGRQPASRSAPTDAEERRVAEAVRRIEAAAEEPISLGELAERGRAQPLSFPAHASAASPA